MNNLFVVTLPIIARHLTHSKDLINLIHTAKSVNVLLRNSGLYLDKLKFDSKLHWKLLKYVKAKYISIPKITEQFNVMFNAQLKYIDYIITKDRGCGTNNSDLFNKMLIERRNRELYTDFTYIYGDKLSGRRDINNAKFLRIDNSSFMYDTFKRNYDLYYVKLVNCGIALRSLQNTKVKHLTVIINSNSPVMEYIKACMSLKYAKFIKIKVQDRSQIASVIYYEDKVINVYC